MDKPTMTIVHGSAIIAEIGYKNETRELFITFGNTGATYVYFDVPEPVFETLKVSSSVGSYFIKNIKNTYKYQKI